MSICDGCIHGHVCGLEDNHEEGTVSCADRIPKDVLDKIKAEIEEKYGDYDICEWFEDYDWDENNISEYRYVGSVEDILDIIKKHLGEIRS